MEHLHRKVQAEAAQANGNRLESHTGGFSIVKRGSKRHTAHHEAGHAVVAFHFAHHIREVSILRDYQNSTAGNVELEEMLPTEADRLERIVVCYAGHAAVVALLGLGDMSHRSAIEHGAFRDYEIADEIALNGGDKGALKRRALALVRRERDAIRRLAAALLRHTFLDSKEVDAVLLGGPFYMEMFPHLKRYMKP